MNPIKVLHVFSDYLPKTQQWLRNIINASKVDKFHFAKHIESDIETPSNIRQYKHQQLFDFDRNNTKPLLKKIYAKLILNQFYPFWKDLDSQYYTVNVDIVHAHFSDIGCEMLNSQIAQNNKLVVSFYGWDYEMLPSTKPIYLEKYKELFEKVNLIIVEGPHGKKILEGYKCPSEKIAVVPLGIEINNTVNDPKTRIDKTKLKLIQVASFREKKGQWYSIQAVHIAIQKGLEVTIEFVGNIDDANYYNTILQYIEKNNLQEYVTFKKFIEYSQLDEYLTNFDTFIQPSCYANNRDCEGGAPTTLFNAMIAGLPIIASNHCDIPFVVKHNVSGFIVAQSNVIELSNAIEKMIELQPEDYGKLALGAQKEVTTRFNIKKNAKKLDELYYEILKL